MRRNPAAYSIAQLYRNVTSVLSNNLSIFQGFTLTDISIDKALHSSTKWNHAYFTGTSKTEEKNYTINLKIPNTLINEYHIKNGGKQTTSARYDIRIKDLTVSSYGTITITADAIKETGVSERELSKRRLTQYCQTRGYINREKRALPKLVTSILALTSRYSEIHDDLLSNLNLNTSRVKVIPCNDSKMIASYIKEAQNDTYDIIVLYRGGREDEAMNIFSSEEIIESIVNESTIPVCAALGHDIDNPFIYTVADQTYSTPSSFSKAITAHNEAADKENTTLLIDIRNALNAIGEKSEEQAVKILDMIELTGERLYEKVIAKVDKLLKDSENCTFRISERVQHTTESSSQKIESYVQSIYQRKLEEIRTTQTRVDYALQGIYTQKTNCIERLSDKIEHSYKQIEEQVHTKETLKSKHKTVIALILVIVILIGIISWLFYKTSPL